MGRLHAYTCRHARRHKYTCTVRNSGLHSNSLCRLLWTKVEDESYFDSDHLFVVISTQSNVYINTNCLLNYNNWPAVSKVDFYSRFTMKETLESVWNWERADCACAKQVSWTLVLFLSDTLGFFLYFLMLFRQKQQSVGVTIIFPVCMCGTFPQRHTCIVDSASAVCVCLRASAKKKKKTWIGLTAV